MVGISQPSGASANEMNVKQDCGRHVAFLYPNARDLFRPTAAACRASFDTLMLRRADAGCRLVLARRLALFGSVTFVDIAGEAIDKPGSVVGWAFKPNVSRSNRRYQGGQ